MSKDYKLGSYIDKREVNRRINPAPHYKRTVVDLESLYPVSNAKNNFNAYLKRELMFEREHYKKFYKNQGFLGRLLVCMIDKITFTTSASLLSKNQSERGSDIGDDEGTLAQKNIELREAQEARMAPSLYQRDRNLIRKNIQINTLADVYEKTSRTLDELRMLNEYLENIDLSEKKGEQEPACKRIIDSDKASKLLKKSSLVKQYQPYMN